MRKHFRLSYNRMLQSSQIQSLHSQVLLHTHPHPHPLKTKLTSYHRDCVLPTFLLQRSIWGGGGVCGCEAVVGQLI